MKIVLPRLNPNTTALQRPYRAYQALAEEQRDDMPSSSLQAALPAEIRHIQNVQVLRSSQDPPERFNTKAVLDRRLYGGRVVAATGELVLELEARARWLADHGEIVEDEPTMSHGQRSGHRLKATLPLTVPGFADVVATVGFSGDYRSIPKKRDRVVHLGYLSLSLEGTNTTLGEDFSTYASISSDLLDVAHPESAGYQVTPGVDGHALVDGFEFRDMLTFVENHAPGANLPKQPYPSHMVHDPNIA